MPNDHVETVRIRRLAQGGDGVSNLADGRIVFVEGGLPGDLVEIELEQSKKKWARARVLRRLEDSPDRIEPDCRHAPICGGCSFRDYSYEAELRAKVDAARDTLQRLGRLELDDVELVEHPATSPVGHRVRASLHIRSGRLGFFRRGTHELFALSSCPALDPRLERALEPLRSFAVALREGEVFVETASGDEVVVTVEEGSAPSPVVAALAAADPIRGVRRGRASYGTDTVSAREALGLDSDIEVPSRRFRQANALMGTALRDIVQRRVGRVASLDEFFAGSGNFTFALREQCGDIRAYELDPEAVKLGNEISASLSCPTIEFRAIDLDQKDVPPRDGASVLLDPPRTGAQRLSKAIAASRAARVVYVSCDVATFARDAAELVRGGFALSSVDFVDMFPRTPHLELVAAFVRTSAR